MVQIEDYALIGDCETSALIGLTARSIGYVYRGLTPTVASQSCSDRKTTAIGAWRLRGGSRSSGAIDREP